ncbi:hypothetical protein EZV62_027136 [Acer yangbiense]|uniref:Retroviral polymerase SH3-like domain-containing protein n=1 Tax=Acer yangbiense TaxID=1000413 RepID=A0A5C7GU40_9ROSI|nr:hypothetical protein EZV62_027136 [Acer yangbiense]
MRFEIDLSNSSLQSNTSRNFSEERHGKVKLGQFCISKEVRHGSISLPSSLNNLCKLGKSLIVRLSKDGNRLIILPPAEILFSNQIGFFGIHLIGHSMKVQVPEILQAFHLLSCLRVAAKCVIIPDLDTIFTRIMACETAKEAWDKLKEEFQGSDRTRQMQVLNLRREFEVLRMKESETVKEYTDKLMKVVNQIRLLGEELTERRIVEKVLISVPERFESKVSSLEDSKDISQLTLTEVINALQAFEQRRAIRLKETKTTEGAFQAKLKRKQPSSSGGRKQPGEKKEKEKKEGDSHKSGGRRGRYPPCPYCKKTSHTENFCWWRPGVKCRACNQLGHVEKVCKNKTNQQGQQAQIAENQEQDEEKLFVATCYATNCSSGAWLIDSGCTNHMTYDVGFFKELDRSYTSKVKTSNGDYVNVMGKGVVAVETSSDVKRDKLDQKSEVGIFLGYSSNAKGYRIYSLRIEKILISRNVKFDESAKWNWEKNEVEDSLKNHNKGVFSQQEEVAQPQIDPHADTEIAVRGTRHLDEIYARCNVAVLEPATYDEAAKLHDWRVAMKEEINMIDKNETWQLVERPENGKVIGVNSENQLADILTKALPKAKFELMRAKLGVSKKNLKEEC